jgi:hypothetical protein
MTTLNSTKSSGGKPFPHSSDSVSVGTAKAEPTIIGRKDIAHEVWQVEDCRAISGEPRTDIGNRVMYAPFADDDYSRAVRAHELMHSKISPTPEQFSNFISRGIASEQAMRVVEELRVNFLCESVGIPVKESLINGSELATGERLSKTGDWAGAVAMTIAATNTNGLKPFLNGVRRHNRHWGDSLLAISKKALKEMKKSSKYTSLGDTREHGGLEPVGFAQTERIAEWVDRIASFPPPPPPPPAPKGVSSSGSLPKDDVEKKSGIGNKGDYTEAKKDGNPLGNISPVSAGGVPSWAELRVERVPLPKMLKGTIGKKRIATNMGRRPRRMHRLLTDPAMRVFDKKIKGSGGMVIIDGSGSMSFTEEQIEKIISYAPGCTVAIYSDRNNDKGSNLWVVADKGKMVESLSGIDYGYGNGVDYPAIVWGVENQKHKTSPLVWITDGGVCGKNDGFHELLSMQCLTYANKHNYIIVPHIEEALIQLSKLANGGKAQTVYPYQFKQTWKAHMGNLPMP